MKYLLGAVIPGLIVICFHCIIAFEVVDYNKITPSEEQDFDKREFASITGNDLNGFVKHRLDSIADNKGFSGITDERLYDVNDQVLRNSMSKRPFDSINNAPFRGFGKRRVANFKNNDRLNWYIQRPINLIGGMSPELNMKQPVDAKYVGGYNRPAIMPRETRYLGYLNHWNLMSNIRLNGFAKRTDEVVDGDLTENRP